VTSLGNVATNTNKPDRGGGATAGIYRAGGPTTIFGGSGWGPYSDGPLNAVRKSLLGRDGVSEENWMWMVAGRVADAGTEWAKWRKEGLRAVGALGADGEVGGGGVEKKGRERAGEKERAMEKQRVTEREMEEEEEEEEEGGSGAGAGTKREGDVVERDGKKQRVGFEVNELPLGVYEPHSGTVHCQCLPCSPLFIKPC